MEENKNLEAFDPEAGLTKREYAAIQIMAGLAASPNIISRREIVAEEAVRWADALFAELDK